MRSVEYIIVATAVCLTDSKLSSGVINLIQYFDSFM